MNKRKTYLGVINDLPPNGIFVFGSNTQGRHGKGAALIARNKFGAIYGQAKGLQGQSYAIVTKDLTKIDHPSVSKEDVEAQISDFYKFAALHPYHDFYIAYDGINPKKVLLSGYTTLEIADMFADYLHMLPLNVIFEFNFFQLIKRILIIE